MEKWQYVFDWGKAFVTLLTDLYKAFDCLDHELLIAKLNAHGFSLAALKLVHNYLSHVKQTVKMDRKPRLWLEIIFRGTSQGLIPEPLLFLIFLADLFFISKYVNIDSNANYIIPDVTAGNISCVLRSLANLSKTLFESFKNNLPKVILINAIY